jgi:hypothetical protein
LGFGLGVRVNLWFDFIRFGFIRFFIGDNIEAIIRKEVFHLLFIHGHRFSRFGFLIHEAEFVHSADPHCKGSVD